MSKAYEQVPAASDPLTSLLEAIAAGCAASFESFYGKTSGRMFGLVLHINGDRGEAEEVLQEVYLKVWQDRTRYDARQGSAMHWLASIARNRAIDSLRRRKVRPTKFEPAADAQDDAYDAIASELPGPLEALIEGRRVAAMSRCVDALPKDQRESMMLAFYSGLSYSEIAQRIGRPVGTVKGWMRRSLSSMRHTLAPDRCAARAGALPAAPPLPMPGTAASRSAAPRS